MRINFPSFRKEISQSGSALIEVMLSLVLVALLITGVVTVGVYAQGSVVYAGESNRALQIAEEGMEAIRNIRDQNFANLANGNYGLAISSGQWVFISAPDVQNGFTRAVTISDISASKKQVVVTVTWNESLPRPGSTQLTSYFTNWANN